MANEAIAIASKTRAILVVFLLKGCRVSVAAPSSASLLLFPRNKAQATHKSATKVAPIAKLPRNSRVTLIMLPISLPVSPEKLKLYFYARAETPLNSATGNVPLN